MEDRPSRGRGGGWKRGGRGGHDSDSHGGDHRGRGRGGHHRGRGKRDHYRGRGRGGSGHAAEFHHRNKDEDFQEEAENTEVFSRRKLESNWDRYAESERQEPEDDTPTQRGADYHVLLESAGDSFTQFRFSEEKDWEMDSFVANQMSAAFVDLPALAQSLQQLPLHQRLNLEAELLQVSTPVELPTVTFTQKQEKPKAATFTPPPAALKVNTSQRAAIATNPASGSQASSKAAQSVPVDDADEELDELLGLQKPVQAVTGKQTVSEAEEEAAAPKRACEEVKEVASKVTEEKIKEVKNQEVTPPKSAPVRKEVTEEDLEDWLDSMIS